MAATLALIFAGGCGSPAPSGPALHEPYSFWPPAPDEPRIQFLRSFRFSADIEPPPSAFDRIVFGTDVEVLPIGKPYGVAMWKGRIYVCDITNPGVVILDLVKRETRLMGTRGVQRMLQPTAIAIAPDGMKYVADRKVNKIFVFDAADRHVSTFGERGLIPVGVAVSGERLLVPDFQTQSVLVLDRFRGETLRSIGGTEEAEGGFVRPLGVAVDASGGIYVSDVIRGRLQKFGDDGTVLMQIGQIADSPGNFVRPKHVAVDAEGTIYVVDAAFQNVQMFDAEGQLLMFFGSPGSHPGSMSLPAGIAVYDGDTELFADDVHPAFEVHRLVVVTNQFGLHKVSVYALGRLKEGHTVADIIPYAAEVRTADVPQPAAGAPPGLLTVPADASDADETPEP
ncbi:MAG: NHL repeat-containing protein [Planctomycetota bacterium]